jgi:hypothetical protein
VIATSDERNSDEKISDLDALGFPRNDGQALAETKSREETSTKNGRSEVTNRHDGLGLGQREQLSEVVQVARLGWWRRTRLWQTLVAARVDGGAAAAVGGEAQARGDKTVLGTDAAVRRD